jgi:hypothetical protein
VRTDHDAQAAARSVDGPAALGVTMLRMGNIIQVAVRLAWLGVACACSSQTAPLATPAPAAAPVEQPAPTAEPDETKTAAASQPADAPREASSKPAPPAVEFADNLSVEQAIAAVPQGYDRVNLEPARMAEPLMEFSIYEACKLAPAQHFRIRVAVWEGRAVGVDVETQPRNETLSQCLRTRVQQLQWRDKVPSLETTEVSF